MVFLLVALLIVVPLAELYVIVQIGGLIGVWPTVALLLTSSILGGFLMRHQGRATWRRFRRTMEAGRLPAKEVVDGALVIVGGALLLAPGFITDVFGLLCLLPITRAPIRAIVTKPVTSNVYVRAARVGSAPFPQRRPAYDVDGTAEEVGGSARPRSYDRRLIGRPPTAGTNT
jgi:UPF0716 protein FxsA